MASIESTPFRLAHVFSRLVIVCDKVYVVNLSLMLSTIIRQHQTANRQTIVDITLLGMAHPRALQVRDDGSMHVATFILIQQALQLISLVVIDDINIARREFAEIELQLFLFFQAVSWLLAS